MTMRPSKEDIDSNEFEQVEGADEGRRLLLDAEATMDGGSEAVHRLAHAADPLADHENRAPEGPLVCPWCCQIRPR